MFIWFFNITCSNTLDTLHTFVRSGGLVFRWWANQRCSHCLETSVFDSWPAEVELEAAGVSWQRPKRTRDDLHESIQTVRSKITLGKKLLLPTPWNVTIYDFPFVISEHLLIIDSRLNSLTYKKILLKITFSLLTKKNLLLRVRSVPGNSGPNTWLIGMSSKWLLQTRETLECIFQLSSRQLNNRSQL